MSGGPKVTRGTRRFSFPWNGSEIEVVYHDPSLRHWDEATKLVVQHGLPLGDDEVLSRKLMEVCVVEVGGERVSERYWTETRLMFVMLLQRHFQQDLIRGMMDSKNSSRRSDAPGPEPPLDTEEPSSAD